MLRITQIRRALRVVTRKFSTELANAKPVETKVAQAIEKEATKTVAPSGGSSFLQRFFAFLAGCGVGFGTSFYFLYDELVESNKTFAIDIAKLSK